MKMWVMGNFKEGAESNSSLVLSAASEYQNTNSRERKETLHV